jgi:small subunit ribosomal protein S20
MANIKSQIKRNRQNEIRHERNKAVRSELKTRVKKTNSALAAGEPAADLYRESQKKLDVAAAKGVIHPKAAARRKSRLAKKVAAAG